MTFEGKTILIVDDEPDLREVIGFELESYGCQVLSAANGLEGLETVKARKVDLVLSDVRMPRGDGIELLQKIKAYDSQQPSVVLMTGFADIGVAEALDLGADGFISKPFEWDSMLNTLDRALLPSEQRWAEGTMQLADETSLEMCFGSFDDARRARAFDLGRGGMFLAITGSAPRVGCKVQFNLSFAEGPLRTLEGAGHVRWIRGAGSSDFPAGCGIEFARLSKDSTRQTLALLQALRTPRFIPLGEFAPSVGRREGRAAAPSYRED